MTSHFSKGPCLFWTLFVTVVQLYIIDFFLFCRHLVVSFLTVVSILATFKEDFYHCEKREKQREEAMKVIESLPEVTEKMACDSKSAVCNGGRYFRLGVIHETMEDSKTNFL